MRLALLAAALLASAPLCAQEKEAPKKKPSATKKAHQKASKDQVRRFNELEKKQQKK